MEGTLVRRLIDVCAPLAASLPGAVLGLAMGIMTLMAMGGSHPLWRVDPVNMSEAAALRDEATVVQLMAKGENPYTRREIRAHLLSADRVELTPLEAGIAAARAEIVEIILFSARERPDAAAWTYLRCLSQLEAHRDINEVLDRYRPESATLACDGITRPWK